ncbi:D-serine deaminase-like pyridoxal phosphate-dependent protein [Saonia flava]|uniref:D-serine deaminase-like pyridoxal phosphate-dependent protein n=1 Tax=Saonia flava TaxID=523696 RepID=A0A846QSS5_9FLAO|nr:D-TA family PLP-dependent enzyme [Saonia flava]NJB71118.1 D-serine deaminase-like pyridoxal phosphate-dependent protein [Saonia flava]
MIHPQERYKLLNTENVISPSLLVYPDIIEYNIQLMIKIAGGSNFLRPHIKTHKIGEIIQLQLAYGITKFKCATIAEAELLAQCNVKDILLAMQPVGANVARFFTLLKQYPNSKFSTIIDNTASLKEIAHLASSKNIKIPIWLDVNCGMDRTGIIPDEKAVKLYKSIDDNPNLCAEGLHAYDGHIHDSNYALRKEKCDVSFNTVLQLKKEIEKLGVSVKNIVAGGSPTFPIHAQRENVETSPGTPLLWDQGYSDNYPDLPFIPAAILFTRVVSKPRPNTICLDLGHKAVASEMPLPRIKILDRNTLEQIGQSEEHLVIKCQDTSKYNIGDSFYAIPIHICPTVAKYNDVLTVVDGTVTGSWKVAARDHKISI